MSIKLGQISIDLVANTVSFSNGMMRASQLTLNSSRNIQRSLALATTAATAMATGIIASLSAVIDKAEDFAFSIQKMADATGTSDEMMSKLAYSAKLAGAPVGLLSTGMERLARVAFSANSGSKEAVQAFAAIGISQKDLQGPLKDNGNLFVAVAKKLDGYAESSNKTGLEQKLLGRSGAELNPLLKQIASGFDTASEQATLFGVVIGDKTAAQARQLHQSMVQLESVALGLSVRLVSGVSPALEQTADKILDVVTSSDGMKVVKDIADDVATSIKIAGTTFQFLADHVEGVKFALGALAALQVGRILLPMISSAATAGQTLGSVGISAMQLIGRLSGVTQTARFFGPPTRAAYEYSAALLNVGRSYGTMAAVLTGLDAALASPLIAAGAALALLSAGLYTFYKALAGDVASSQRLNDAPVQFQDYWKAAIDNASDSFHAFAEMVSGFSLTKGLADYKSIPTFGHRVHQEANNRDQLDRYLHSGNLEQNAVSETPKKEAPSLPKMPTDKVDHFKLRMDELAASANAAMQSLADAGKGVDFERADEATKEYTKTLLEMEAAAIANGDAFTDADRARVREYVTTRVNDAAQAKFVKELTQTTEQVLAQARAHEILNAVIGKGADAVSRAQQQSEFITRTAGQSTTFLLNNAAEEQRLTKLMETARQQGLSTEDKTQLKGIEAEIAAQQRLVDTILKGKDARDAATLANRQAAINKDFDDRGDTNKADRQAALAADEKAFELAQRTNDLNKAASMDPARSYRDEAKAIDDAAEAARKYGEALSDPQIAAAQKANWLAYQEAVDKTTLAVGTASDGVRVFFEQMSRQTESAAQQMHDALGSSFESLNGMLDKLISGQKVNFAEFFRGIAGQMGKLALEKGQSDVAGGVMGLLGKKSSPQESAQAQTNQLMHQSVDTQMAMSTTLTGILEQLRSGALTNGSTTPAGGLTSAITGAASSGAGLGSITSALAPFTSVIPGLGLFGSVLGAFGGHRALGGDVKAGVTYDVGEMGREEFTPTQDGKITPTNKMSGSTAYYTIDARGANEEAVNQRVRASLLQVHESAIRTSVSNVRESVRRRPRSAKF